jgi:hypothetical protein
MDGHFVKTDDRGRASLGRPDRQYLMHEQEDGTLVLEPAVVISELERRLLSNHELQAQIEHARAHPEERVPRKRRR